MTLFNIYCDESCHLENDHQRAMVIGAVVCPTESARKIAADIRLLKSHHALPAFFEVKWTKVSPSGLPFYRELLDYFFSEPNLSFRAIVIPDKSKLRHDLFGHDHDTFYYKMYYEMLRGVIDPSQAYRIYLDVKDTRSAAKERTLHEVLCNQLHDFDRRVVPRLQSVRSHEVEQVQLADLLVGAVSYENRGMSTSRAKTELARQLRGQSGGELTATTPQKQGGKVNILRWRATGS